LSGELLDVVHEAEMAILRDLRSFDQMVVTPLEQFEAENHDRIEQLVATDQAKAELDMDFSFETTDHIPF
jgi:hypothetical protein